MQPQPPPGLYAGLPPRDRLSGLAAGAVWLALFGSLGRDLASYAWWTIGAGVSAWLVALILTQLGDRGVALGVACASGVGLSVMFGFVALRWIDTLDFPLW